MISHKQINRVILILTFVIMICASPYCSAGSDEGRDTSEIKTGDIEVFARGIDPPPYKDGFKLIINKMPYINDGQFPEFITKIPDSAWNSDAVHDEILDSLGIDGSIILNYFYDSLGLKKHIIKRLKIFSDLKVAEAITDSTGNYIFEKRSCIVGISAAFDATF